MGSVPMFPRPHRQFARKNYPDHENPERRTYGMDGKQYLQRSMAIKAAKGNADVSDSWAVRILLVHSFKY